jgi:leader peptidase (prepilin peptidase)/N-methyltransferase
VSFVLQIFAFLFGTAIGSFLNVVMYRLPQGISIVKPNSFCPACKKPIVWYENIPLVSYILLKGKCSNCRKPISIRYFLVELITGLIFLYLFVQNHLSLSFLFYACFFSVLIAISGIDFEHQVIPDILSMPGILIGLIFHLIQGSFLPSLIGAAFGGGLILLIRTLGGWVYKKEVMGLGDVYLTAMIGAFVGFPIIIPAIFIGALIGAVLGIVYVISTRQSRESPIPFGPFLSLGGMFVIIFKPQVIQFFATLGVNL